MMMREVECMEYLVSYNGGLRTSRYIMDSGDIVLLAMCPLFIYYIL